MVRHKRKRKSTSQDAGADKSLWKIVVNNRKNQNS